MMCPREDNLGYVSTGGFSKLECGIMQKFEEKRGVLLNFSVIFAHRAQFFHFFARFFRLATAVAKRSNLTKKVDFCCLFVVKIRPKIILILAKLVTELYSNTAKNPS